MSKHFHQGQQWSCISVDKRLQTLESELAAVRAKADRYEKALEAIAEQEAYWRAGHNLAKQALSGEAGK